MLKLASDLDSHPTYALMSNSEPTASHLNGRLTVASLQSDASGDSTYDGETDDVATVVFHKTLELLDLLLQAAPVVPLSPGLHVHMRTVEPCPARIATFSERVFTHESINIPIHT